MASRMSTLRIAFRFLNLMRASLLFIIVSAGNHIDCIIGRYIGNLMPIHPKIHPEARRVQVDVYDWSMSAPSGKGKLKKDFM